MINVVPTTKHDVVSIMVVEGERAGDLIPVKEIMEKQQYHLILQRHVIPSG